MNTRHNYFPLKSFCGDLAPLLKLLFLLFLGSFFLGRHSSSSSLEDLSSSGLVRRAARDLASPPTYTPDIAVRTGPMSTKKCVMGPLPNCAQRQRRSERFLIGRRRCSRNAPCMNARKCRRSAQRAPQLNVRASRGCRRLSRALPRAQADALVVTETGIAGHIINSAPGAESNQTVSSRVNLPETAATGG